MSEERPDRTTMEGMIWNANHVLEQALNPGFNGVPKELFHRAVGIILISIVEAGFVFSGNVGTGIILAKNQDKWSAPCACGFTGVGWGFLVGGSIKDIIVFIMDATTMDSAMGSHGIKFGGQLELSVGPFGRAGKVDIDLSDKGAGGTVSVAFSKGAFLGVNIEGGVTGVRDAVNSSFYGKTVSAKEIVSGAVEMPADKVTMIEEVYNKLEQLSQGETAKPDAAEESKKSLAKSEADKAAESANKAPDVVKIDSKVEASK